MKEKQDYIKDIAEIRSMMERSTKFLSLAGWAGIMAGLYALAGVYIAIEVFGFNPAKADTGFSWETEGFQKVFIVAVITLLLAVSTAVLLSVRKGNKAGEKVWNATARRLVLNMAVPLVFGGILILILISHGFIFIAPALTLIFYGLSLYNAGKFTYAEVSAMGIIQLMLGLAAALFINYSMLFWSTGFGLVHIAYGIYMHYKYEK